MADKGSIKKTRTIRSGSGQGSIEISGGGGRRTSARSQTGGARTSAPSQLERAFGAAAKTMNANRAQLNAMDGQNGNHGDNMVYNMRVINQSLRAKRGQAPAEGLRAAAEALREKGHGGTGHYYAEGLARAADKVQGREQLDQNDVLGLVQSLMGAVPAQGYPDAQSAGGGSLLEGLLGMATGAAQPQSGSAGGAGLDMGDLLNVGMSLLGGGQAGGGQAGGGLQAILGALAGGGGGERTYGSAREASGSMLLQTVLKTLLK